MNANSLEALVANMSLAELAQRSGRSVEELVNWALGGKAPAPAKAAPARPAPAAAAKEAKPARRVVESEAPARRSEGGASKEVNTRTPEGRKRYSEAVLKLVQEAKGPIAATDIRDRLGGTPLQVRAALNKWIEEGKITYQGQARAMRYSAA